MNLTQDEKKARIYDELVALDVILGTEQKKERLVGYVNHLETYPLGSIISILRGFHRRLIYFPRLAEIIENLEGFSDSTIDLANVIASDIISCISKFGPGRIEEVKKELGPNFVVVEKFGRWADLCAITYNEVNTVRAQLRELAKGQLNRSKREAQENRILKNCSDIEIEFKQ